MVHGLKMPTIEEFEEFMRINNYDECIIDILYKYEWEKVYTGERLYVNYNIEEDTFYYSNDWNEGQSECYVERYILLKNIDGMNYTT